MPQVLCPDNRPTHVRSTRAELLHRCPAWKPRAGWLRLEGFRHVVGVAETCWSGGGVYLDGGPG